VFPGQAGQAGVGVDGWVSAAGRSLLRGVQVTCGMNPLEPIQRQ
jgi:hypothetical protein